MEDLKWKTKKKPTLSDVDTLNDPVLTDVRKKPTLSDVDTLLSLELGSAMCVFVLKLDNTSFDVSVMNSATVKDLKVAVEKRVNEMEQSKMGHCHISWYFSFFCDEFCNSQGFKSNNLHIPIVVPMASKAARKAIYLQKLHKHLIKDNTTHLVIVSADNLCVKQSQAIRQGLQPHSLVVMGKNSLIKRSLALHAPSTGKPAFVGAVPHIVGLVLTGCDPDEVSETIAGYKMQPLVCSSMDIGMCSLWQWLLGFHLNLVSK